MLAGESKPDLHRPGKIIFLSVTTCSQWHLQNVNSSSTVLCSKYNVAVIIVMALVGCICVSNM